MKKIAVYYRVSTDMQQTTSQRCMVDEYLQQHPDAEIRVFEDLAMSGKNTDRPAYQEMLRAVLAKEVDIVVTYALDRISRNSSDAIMTILSWRTLGVGFVPVSQIHLKTDAGSPIQNTMLALFADLAQLERESIIKRIKSGVKAKRASHDGKWGRPSNLTQSDSDEIMRLSREGHTCREIAELVGVSKSTVSNVQRRVSSL